MHSNVDSTPTNGVKYDIAEEKVIYNDHMKSGPGEMVMIREIHVQPNDYMSYAIIVTICCCLPLGLIAIIRSSQVRSRFDNGDLQGARLSAKSSRRWSIAGVVLGSLCYLLSILSIVAALFLVG
ncbi:proline-rich transmembrane protein 1-like [Antedon mediterranea]|uniref:proline-rich transmembrane protein 1-like n=1 Tax=Antedon mediterranea TaxID=105859 RepID=UPI003AF4E5D4